MKSRTSYFDLAVLKKNITRFAPVWGLYCATLLIVFLMASSSEGSVRITANLADTTASFAIINFIYAFAAAQMLWGDLYNTRMCNALHALPLRRENWFLTGTVSGLLFSLVPNLVFALVMIPFCGNLWPIAPLWLGATTLQYLCFFGLATLAAFLVGNRFGMGLLYGILNFFSMIFYGLLYQLYLPNMYGIVLRQEHFTRFTPVVTMLDNYDLIQVNWEYIRQTDSYSNVSWSIGEGWGYLGICAGVGIVALTLALLLYRKRNLECAGDLIAVKPLAPVVLGIYTLCGGALFSLLFGFGGDIYSFVGLTIGFFTGKMLLERQVRVFRKGNLLAFVAVVLVFCGSIATAQYDVLGLEKWVPKARNVAAVNIDTGSSYYYYSNRESGLVLEDPADIENILEIHETALGYRDWIWENDSTRLQLTYQMKGGMRRSREYWIEVDSQAGQTLKGYFSSREAVLEELDYLGTFQSVEISESGRQITDSQDLALLLDAIAADCQAGTMAQDTNFYPQAQQWHWVTLEFRTPEGVRYYRELRFWEGCENIMAWVQDVGVIFEKYE